MSNYRSFGLGTRRSSSDEERILPLINIVVLLLIFFMLAGQFSASDPFRVKPPRSLAQGQPAEQEMTVSMDADGRLALDGTIIETMELKKAVAARLSSEGIVEVRLKADGAADATRVIVVMELLRHAGVERLHLLTLPGKG